MIEYIPSKPWDSKAFEYSASIGEVLRLNVSSFDLEVDNLFKDTDISLVSFKNLSFNLDEIEMMAKRGFTPIHGNVSGGLFDGACIWALSRHQWQSQQRSKKYYSLDDSIDELIGEIDTSSGSS